MEGSAWMKINFRILFEILLVLFSAAVFIYNFMMQREIVYISSVAALCGTIFMLIKDIKKSRG